MNPLPPYVIGQWVSGAKFYGREALLTALLQRPGGWHWVAGLRRVGKTSLLKQLETLARAPSSGCFPLFWDLQGVDCREDLALSFGDALLDSEETLEQWGIPLASVEDPELSDALRKLITALDHRGGALLLLCDELDEAVALEVRFPGFAAELWGTLSALGGTRVVAASSVRLCDLAASAGAAGRLMAPFSDPSFLGALTAEEASALLRQDQLPPPSRPALAPAEIDTLVAACGHHPMLLQMAGKRCLEVGGSQAGLRQLATDRVVQHLFAVDFDLLAAQEQAILRAVAHGGDAAREESARLLALGILRQRGRSLEIPNRLLAAWLRQTQ